MLDKYEIVKYMNSPDKNDGKEVYKNEDDCLYAVDSTIQAIRGIMMSRGEKKVQFQGFGAFGAKLTIEDTTFKELMNSIEASNKRLANTLVDANKKDNVTLAKSLEKDNATLSKNVEKTQSEGLAQIKSLLKKHVDSNTADTLIKQMQEEQNKQLAQMQNNFNSEVNKLKAVLVDLKALVQNQTIQSNDELEDDFKDEFKNEISELKKQIEEKFGQSNSEAEAQQTGFYHTMSQQFQEVKELLQNQNKDNNDELISNLKDELSELKQSIQEKSTTVETKETILEEKLLGNC